MEKRNILKNQKGFTLIELIATLIILGILAAVAVPKFLNLQDDARIKAVEGALAAGASNATLSWSQYLLRSDGTVPTKITDNAWIPALPDPIDDIETDLGDFTASYSYKKNTKKVTVTITDGPNWFSEYTDTKTKTFKLNSGD